MPFSPVCEGTQPGRRAKADAAIVCLLFTLLLLTGCSRFVDRDQSRVEPGAEVTLEPGYPVGQTFVARHAGLSGVEVWLNPQQGSQGEIHLHLRPDPQAEDDLATAALPLAQCTTPGFYRFSFVPLRGSHSHYYYAFLEMAGDARIQAGVGPGEAYLDGSLYRNHQPLDAQMTFRLVYDPRWMLLDLGRAAFGGLWLLLVAGLLYVVPGWALLAWLWPRGQLSWAERLGIAAGLSLALYPLLLLWTDLIGLHLGPLYAWLPVVIGLAALGWRYRAWRPRKAWMMLQEWARSEALWPDLALFVVLGLVFGVRLLVVRTLDAPMWGDSYQHTMVAQLLVDHGGLFDSWQPYVPLKSFTYHFGFQVAVALYHWLTNISIIRAVMIVGQIVNGLAALTLYPLAVRIGSTRWAGVLTVLVAGLLSPMPMYYVNWGRYVQLAGQVILPVAVWLTWESLTARQHRLSRWMLTGLAVAGLVLTHYLVAIYFALALFVVWAASTVKAWRSKNGLHIPLTKVLFISFVSLAFVLPWMWHLWAGYLPKILSAFAHSQSRTSASYQYDVLQNVTFYAPAALLVVALGGLVIGLARRKSQVLLVALWVALLFLAANPNWLGLPGVAVVSNFQGVLNNFAVLISLYVPISILCGYLGSNVLEGLSGRLSWLQKWVAVGLIVISSLINLKGALTVIDPSYVLVTFPDMQAMQWIRVHTPESSKFLANYFFAYDGNVIVGSDAGWWIPMLAHRENTVPPITYGHEATYDPNYISKVNGFARQLEGASFDSSKTLALLLDNGVTHVYVGQQGGSIPVNELQESSGYRLVYHKDRVWIFEVLGHQDG